MTAALVVVPTHDHAELLALSLASLREQTVADLEIAVICDGVGDETRDVVGDARRHDPRIVLHDLPKAGRTGEPHRHPIISQSDAEVVVYLCDDDLLLPDHVEQMLEVLQSNDLAVSLPLCVDGEGSLVIEPVDLGQAGWRRLVLDARESYLSLTGLAHTTESYRRLPRGWTTTPSGYFTDQWMYLAFLGEPWVRAATTARGTALRFPSVLRREWSDQERLDELRNWSERLATPAGLASIGAETDGLVLNSAMTWRRIAHELATTLDHHQAALEEERHQASVAAEQARRDSDAAVVAHRGDAERLVAHGQRIEAERDAVAAELMSVAAALRTAQGESEASQRALRALRATRTMRARNAMLRWPLVRSLLARRS